jgi:hypothetical protein
MNKLNLILLLVMTIATAKAQPADYSPNVKKILTSVDRDEIIEIYQDISASDRYDYWKARLGRDIQSGQLNTVELRLLEEILGVLRIDFFTDTPNPEKEDFMNRYLPAYLENVEMKFRQEYLDNTFTISGEAGIHCNCNSGTSISLCPKDNCRTAPQLCKPTRYGCGPFGLFSCTGKCLYR